jgi:hypothetical protein
VVSPAGATQKGDVVFSIKNRFCMGKDESQYIEAVYLGSKALIREEIKCMG